MAFPNPEMCLTSLGEQPRRIASRLLFLPELTAQYVAITGRRGTRNVPDKRYYRRFGNERGLEDPRRDTGALPG
jgi:hypothetical protein